MSKKILTICCVLVLGLLLLGACASAAPAPATPEVVESNDTSNENQESTETTEVEVSEPTAQPTKELTEEPTEEPVVVTEDESALKVTGAVASEMAWTEDEVYGMATLDVESTNSKGETETYTGILISELVNLAAPNSDSTTLVFVADDGYTAEISLSEILACENCILSFRSKGGFSSVLPGYDKNMQVKGVVELQVK